MESRRMKMFGPLPAIGLAGLLMTGCAWSVGGKKGGNTVIEPTKGEQLIGLQKAHKSGAIDDAEYEKLKAEIVGK
jgi:hypothetical protein